MNADAKAFIEDWIDENIQATNYEPEGDATAARAAAIACFRDADRAHISRPAIQAAVGNLQDYMAAAIRAANEAEVARLVAKDD
jgi:hypothetical protein